MPNSDPTAVVLGPDDESRDGVVDALQEEGLEVAPVETELGFLQHLRDAGFPDLVCLSAQPERGGDRGAVLIGLQATDRRPPVIVYTPISARDQAAALIHMGACASVVVPVQEDELRAVARRALRLGQAHQELTRLNAALGDFRTMTYAALTHLWDGVVVVDPGSKVQFINKEGGRLLLKERAELLDERLDPTFAEGFLRALHMANQSPEGRSQRQVAVGTGDSALMLDARAMLIRNLTGGKVGGMLAFRPKDLGKLRKLKAKKAAKEKKAAPPPPPPAPPPLAKLAEDS